MPARPTISLAMIIRDEEAYLPRCLEAARAVVDEIVCVDTGSTDRSAEIARSHGARVESRPWTDDFAAARNASLALCRGAWILVLDADEVIDPSAGPILRALAADAEAEGAYVRMRNVYGERREIECLIPRVFRNRRSHRFVNRIHEQVLPSVLLSTKRHGTRILDPGIRVTHDGYRPDVVAARAKNDRNTRLFRLELADHPDNLYARYKFADHLRKFEDRDAVLRELETAWDQALRLPPPQAMALPFLGEIPALLALELIDQGDADRADQVCGEGRDHFAATPHLLYVSGHAALRNGRPAAAVEFFRLCMAMDGKVVEVPAQVGVTDSLASAGLVSSLAASGRAAEALHAILQRLRTAPADGLHWLRGGELLIGLGLLSESVTWLERARTLRPDDPEASRSLGEALLAFGEIEKAFETWSAFPRDPGCGAGLALIHIAMGEPMAAPPDFGDPEVRSAFGGFVRTLARAERTALLENVRRGADALRAAEPRPAEILDRFAPAPVVSR